MSTSPDLLAAMQAIIALLSQPVQFAESSGPAATTILRGDCAAAKNIAIAAVAKARK